MQNSPTCPKCREAARLEKTIWATNRPPVRVYVCDGCEHTYLVHESPVLVPSLRKPQAITPTA
jgi:transposase-like protein